MRSHVVISVAAIALFGASACTSGVRQALGAERSAPDEFRVVTIAPLVVPPEYNLRPPQPGQPRPEDLFPETRSIGTGLSENASRGEVLLARSARANEANPNVRALIDGETAGVVRKNEGFANRILFWRGRGETPDTDRIAPITPEEEAQRIEEVAGQGDVTITRPRTVRQRIPGI